MKGIGLKELKRFRGQFIGVGGQWGELGFDEKGCFLCVGGMITRRVQRGDEILIGDEDARTFTG
jgi:hypothetical protein